MSSPLIERLIDRHGCVLLDDANYQTFVDQHDYVVLFCPNDPVLFPESNDVAVILPELLHAFEQPLQAAVIGRNIERELQRRFRFTRWPALVFLKHGGYLGALTGIHNWHDYLTEGERILQAPVGDPPPFDLDKVCSGGIDRERSLPNVSER